MGSASTDPAAESVLAHLCDGCAAAVDAGGERCPRCHEARPRGGWSLDPYIGCVLASRYRLLQRLGQGGIGTVYRAVDQGSRGAEQLGEVAVKVFTAPQSGSERRRFLNEARAARSLNSPHIVKVYDFGVENDVPFLVMELLRGVTVGDELRAEGALALGPAIAIARQVCAALHEAHEAGIVHRDLKPDNMMLLDPDRSFVKVLDFGAVGRVMGPDATQSIVGTPHYMAPEQIEGRAVDRRTDIYALGVCLFRMLSGRQPYDGDNTLAVMNAHLDEPIPQLTDEPSKLNDLVTRLLAKAREDRPGSLAEVDTLLAALGSREAPAITVTPPHPMALARTVSVRAKSTGWSQLALVAIPAVLALGWLVQRDPPLQRVNSSGLSSSRLAAPSASALAPQAPPAAAAPAAEEPPTPIRTSPAAPRPDPSAITPPPGSSAQPVASASAAATDPPRAGTLSADEF
jgi:serine/threonine-protein kinase